MRKKVLYSLTLQEQMLLTRFCVMRKYEPVSHRPPP